jgi:hypothetical protein
MTITSRLKSSNDPAQAADAVPDMDKAVHHVALLKELERALARMEDELAVVARQLLQAREALRAAR